MGLYSANNKNNRRCSSADGFSLLPSALQPRLFSSLLRSSSLSPSSSLLPSSLLFCLLSILLIPIFCNNNIALATTSTLNLTIDNAALALDIKPISTNGTFASSSNLTIGANTNNYTGYILKIAAKTANDRNLSEKGNNNNNNTTYFAPIPTATTLTSFSDDTASGAVYNNKWGYLPSRYCTTTEIDNTPTTKCSNNSNNTYLPAPDTTGDILDITSNANASTATSDNNNYTIAIGARATTSTKASTYEGTFIIQMVANATPYTITYNKNTEDTVDNMPANETSSVIGDIATISNTVPKRDGYILTGWCTEAVADNSTCDAPYTQYAAGGTYTLDQTAATNNLELYAMWKLPTLYDKVAAMSKGKQTDLTQLQASITKPTSADYTRDTSNSGVYEYNASLFGDASDAANTSTIYYYRGILENATSTYGSNGSAVTYPNYVVLSNAGNKSNLTTTDTCWRIVRTTGSGGVKMIYNGTWTGSTCANAQGNAQVTTSAFNSSYNSIVYVGYTYNSNYTNNSSTNGVSPDVVFGNGSSPTTNNVRSTIKTYIEDTWYPSSLAAYTNILEPSAGYCNDRSYYGSTTGTTLEEIQATISASGDAYFGARNRNSVDNSVGPSLNCTRGDVDVYRYVANSSGLSNELKVPAALLTADEAALAGSGRFSGNPTTYSTNSYLCSGDIFWLLSPTARLGGGAYVIYPSSSGSLNGNVVSYTTGVRPAISLTSETTAASGTGIATDPWIVNPLAP